MFLLTSDVMLYRLDLGKADGENAVTILPREIVQVGTFRFQPERRTAFDFLDHFRRLAGARERREQVNVIFHAAEDEGLAIVIRQDAAEVMVQFVAQ